MSLPLIAEIVGAYVSNNTLPAADLPALIVNVSRALREIDAVESVAEVIDLKPAVPVKKSITDTHIVCLEDGLKFKSLKRHIRTKYNLTPDEYRAKWGLPKTYPMVAPGYAATRSELAKRMGLGTTGRSK